MKQSTAQDATRRVCNDTAMDDKEGTMRSLQQINTCSTDQRINRSTDQQTFGSTGQRINGSKTIIKIANKQNKNIEKFLSEEYFENTQLITIVA